MQKVRFTLWMDEDVLKAARIRAGESGSTPSRVIAEAARTVLIDNPQNQQERVLAAVENVFNLIQRMDLRRGYDQQVLREMIGLLVQSFFNHTPAIPEKDKKAALHSGKARFNRFLDTLATNLRGGQSILNDLLATEAKPATPAPSPAVEIVSPAVPAVAEKAVQLSAKQSAAPEAIAKPELERPDDPPVAKPARWSLFGWKETENDQPE